MKKSINIRKLLLITFLLPVIAYGQMSNYRPILATASFNGQKLLLLRSFEKLDSAYYLAVDLKTMNTSIIAQKKVKPTLTNWTKLQSSYPTSPYLKALLAAKAKDFNLQDAGISHGYPPEKGITLTIDLCPSKKPLDREVFSALIDGLKSVERPVPVGLSLSGKFLLNHSDDINWLFYKAKKGELSITWINHSYHHYYQPGLALEENFLLKPGTDLATEVLGNEKAMLANGIVPSIFFRFPGLVSDRKLVDSILNYGLIPIGSDAWLAKGQPANQGSIVLIHGNGNEPIGVRDFLQLLRSQQQAVSQKQWLLFDLRTTISEEENN